MEAQTILIRKWLDRGNTITAYQALEWFKCFRLASRIFDLKSSGFAIEKEMILLDNGKRIAQYKKAPDSRS